MRARVKLISGRTRRGDVPCYLGGWSEGPDGSVPRFLGGFVVRLVIGAGLRGVGGGYNELF